MADDLKRVGLVFKADGTADFAKSLKTVNTLTQENYSAFKLAKSQWDSSTSSLQKLRDTQSYLASQTEAYSSKVYTLKEQLAELENAENKNEQAIAKKRTALNNAQVTLNKYKSGLDEVNAQLKSGQAQIEEYAKKVEEFCNKTKKVGTTLTKSVTTSITAISAGALKAWTELDDAYDTVAKGTGAVDDQLADLQNSFDNVFSKVESGASDVSTTIADINTRFGFTGEILENASVSFLHFAEVNNTDVSNAIALVSRAMGDAGIESSEYASLLDQLTAASQGSGLGIDKLTESLTKYGAPMRALGFDTKESIALFASWEKAGVNTEIAFSGMKKAISNFASAGKDAKVEFKNTLDEIKKCPDIASATTKAIEVFGTKAGPDLADAIKEGRFEYQDMLDILENSQGQLENSFEATLDPMDKSKIAMNNLKLVASDLGSEIQEGLGPVFESLTEILKDCRSWFGNLSPTIKKTIVILGALLAMLGPLLVAIGTLAGPISKAISLFGQFKLAMFGATEQAGIIGSAVSALNLPIIGIIAIIGVLVVAILNLWNTNDDFRKKVISMINNLTSIISNFWNSFLSPIIKMIMAMILNLWQNSIIPLYNVIQNFVANVISKISELVNAITPLINLIVNILATILIPIIFQVANSFTTMVQTSISILSVLLNSASGIINGITQIIHGLIDFVAGVFTGDWSRAWQGVINIFSGIFNSLSAIARAPINGVIAILNGAIYAINQMIRGLNNLHVDIPSWVPGVGGKKVGFNIGYLGSIAYLAKGGNLLQGTAIVGEKGPELLQQLGNQTKVTPLSESGGANQRDLIDYPKLAEVFITALKSTKIVLDRRELGKFVRSF